ncbi:MAG: hypothetical protein EBU52_18630 [Cytophagia bacterium]|nr:hypothetical protein [Cytophagia bacterium]
MATFSVNKIQVIIFLLAALLLGCKLDRKKEVDRNRFSFKAYPDSRAFFNNVRMIYYDREQIANSEVVAFRFKARSKDTTEFHLSPTIVINQQTNDALLFIESTQPYDSITLMIDKKVLMLKDRNRDNVLEFATLIYESIIAEKSIYLNNEKSPLFKDEDERENFRKVMSDYYRLTRIF